MTITTDTTETQHGLGTSEYSEILIRPTTNVGTFGWVALLGIPLLVLYLIYTKMEPQPLVMTSPTSHAVHQQSAPASQHVIPVHPQQAHH